MSACCFVSIQPSSVREREREGKEKRKRERKRITFTRARTHTMTQDLWIRSKTNAVFCHLCQDACSIGQLPHTTCLPACFLSQSPLRCEWSCCSRSQHGATRWSSAARFGEIRHPAWFGFITLSPLLHHCVTASPPKCCASSAWAPRTTESTSAWLRTGWAEPRQPRDSTLCLLVRTISQE